LSATRAAATTFSTLRGERLRAGEAEDAVDAVLI
jgi:hypothetical protein